MKIKSIKAFAITNPTMGGAYSVRRENEGLLRRPPWTKDAEVANPMSRYPPLQTAPVELAGQSAGSRVPGDRR